jgi:hypothetical protein
MIFRFAAVVAAALLWATGAYPQAQIACSPPSESGLEHVLDLVSKLGVIVALFSAALALYGHNQTRKKSSADTYFRLEEKFYHTDLMRGLRRAAANELVPEGNKYRAFFELGDFFDFVGIMLRQGAIDIEMAHSSFYRRATAFWRKGEECGAIAQAIEESHPKRWDEFKYLVEELERRQAEKDGAGDGRLSPELMNNALSQEKHLPSLERWKSRDTLSRQQQSPRRRI